jgi:steroid delta-isomerase-like uncharacterized protein
VELETKVDSENAVKKYVDALNRHNMEAVAATLDRDVVSDDPFNGQIKGRDAFVKYAGNLYKACPNTQDKTLNIIAKGDIVAAEFLTSGTFTAPLESPRGTIPPTGRHFEVRSAIFYRVNSKGLIEERRQYGDTAKLFQQLGLKA